MLICVEVERLKREGERENQRNKEEEEEAGLARNQRNTDEERKKGDGQSEEDEEGDRYEDDSQHDKQHPLLSLFPLLPLVCDLKKKKPSGKKSLQLIRGCGGED